MASPPSPLHPFRFAALLHLGFLISCCILHVTDSARPLYTSIISFGDSLADTGNLLLSGGAPPFPAVGRLPYGMTYFGHPTGRYCDGRLVVDFIAEAFGVPKLRPYLGGPGQDFRRGVNFAVAGATALDAAFFEDRGIRIATNHSLNVQLRWFEELKPSLCRSPRECSDYFRRSLFLVGEIGWNDYNYPFLNMRSISEARSYVPLVIRAIVSATERLIQHGAVKLLVPGTPATGCNPLYLTNRASPNRTDYDPHNGCLKPFNSFSQYHNTMLKRALVELRKKYPGARIIYADYYGPGISFANSPNAFGFSNGALKSCCGGGGPYNYNASALCGQRGSRVYGSPSTFVNWDGGHTTEAANRALATPLIRQARDAAP